MRGTNNSLCALARLGPASFDVMTPATTALPLGHSLQTTGLKMAPASDVTASGSAAATAKLTAEASAA